MGLEANPIDEPPDDLPGAPPKLRRDRPAELWRLHWEDDPSNPVPKDPGKWRFDAPKGEYPVTYANPGRHHVFVEVYGDTDTRREIQPDQADRKISVATVARDLRLVDLGDALTLSRLGVDGRICTALDYPNTQHWSKRIREWLPDADGIRYNGRKAGRKDNYCLYLDRCADALNWRLAGTVASEHKLVMQACQMFDIVPRVYFSKPGDPWP